MSDLSSEKSNIANDSAAMALLWKKMLLGDHTSFEKVYHLTFPKLYRYGCSITSEDLVEEIMQELFIHIWHRRSELPVVSNPISYLFRSFRNMLLNHIKKMKKKQTIPLEAMPDFSYSLSEETNRTYNRETLQKAINKLSYQQREVIYLLYFNDLTAAEVAEVLSLKVRTIYNTAHNALNVLRNHLPKDFFMVYLLSVSLFFATCCEFHI